MYYPSLSLNYMLQIIELTILSIAIPVLFLIMAFSKKVIAIWLASSCVMQSFQ